MNVVSDSDLQARLARLSPEQREALERLVLQRAAEEELHPRAGAGPTPLSPLQEGLWVADRLLRGGPGFTVGSALRLRGPLDVDALARSIEHVGARHEVLRTAIVVHDGLPHQMVRREQRLVLERISVDAGGDAERAALELVRSASHFTVDIAQGRPLRAILLQLAADDHILLVLTHHIVWDAWSWRIFLGEVAELYSAAINARTPALPELPVSYCDYAVWTRERLDGRVGRAQLEHWRERLAGAPPELELAPDRPRPPVRDGAGGFLRHPLPRDVVEGAHGLARSERVTSYMTMLAAYAALLARHTGQDDIVIGTPFAGDRNRPQLEHLIGLFVNMLPLRIDVSDAATFRELLSHVREIASDAFANYEVPFEHLVRELRPARALAQTPLFQATFNLRHPGAPFALEGIETETLRWGQPLAQYDLMLDVELQGAAAETSWVHNRNVFEKETVAELARQFELLLTEAVARPDVALRELQATDDAERARVLAWCGRPNRARSDACIHELVARWAQATPDAPALVDGERTLTYAELVCSAERLAARLRAAGVRPDTAVGVLVERSAEMVIAFLAVLQAGAAYVPLDPDYPAARLERMLSAVDAGALVVHRTLLDRLRRMPDETVFVIDDDDVRPDVSLPRARADQLAYIVFTSGSTGEPKPVGATHHGVVVLVVDANFARVGPDDRIALVSTPAFDAATFEMWGPLLNGATLCILAREDVVSPVRLADAVERHGITVLHVPAALVNDDEHRRRLARLGVRQLLFGGEAANPTALRSLLESGFSGVAVNCYGPTEATMLASFAPVDLADTQRARVPIGRAVSGSEVYVLDELLRPAPVGMPGELCIGGDRLARGYLGAPRLTAERFVPSPYGPRGARLYRTGDRARFLPDGRLDFLGRRDRQVKVRGFRIEPGEVEAALAALPDVSAAAVAVHAPTPAGRRLVGYVAPTAGARLDGAALRRALRATLPEYMVPAEVVVLDQLPLTPNGKVDHRALPLAPAERAPRARTAPRTATEELVAAAWRGVLGVDDVDIDEDFFDVGGHSLLAVALLARISEAAGVEVPVEALFGDATIAGITGWLDAVAAERTANAVVTLRAGDRRTVVLAHPIGGGLLAYRALTAALGPDVVVLGLEARRPAHASLAAAAAQYANELAASDRSAPLVLAGWSAGGVLAHEVAVRLLERGCPMPPLVLVDSWPPDGETVDDDEVLRSFLFDLARGMSMEPPLLGPELADLLAADALALLARERPELAQAGVDELIRRYELFAANLRAFEQHVPRRYDGAAQLVVPAASTLDPETWRPLVGSLTLVRVPGDHHSVLQPPAVAAVARAIERVLDPDD